MTEKLFEVCTVLITVLVEDCHIIKVCSGELLAVSDDMVNHTLEHAGALWRSKGMTSNSKRPKGW